MVAGLIWLGEECCRRWLTARKIASIAPSNEYLDKRTSSAGHEQWKSGLDHATALRVKRRTRVTNSTRRAA